MLVDPPNVDRLPGIQNPERFQRIGVGQGELPPGRAPNLGDLVAVDVAVGLLRLPLNPKGLLFGQLKQ